MVSVNKGAKALLASLLALVLVGSAAPLASANGDPEPNGYTAEFVVTALPSAVPPGATINLTAAAGGCQPGTPFTVRQPPLTPGAIVASGTVAPDGGWTASFVLDPTLTTPQVLNFQATCGDTAPNVFTTTFGIAVLVNTFIDVPDGQFFTEPVEWASALGVTTGVGGSDQFRPFDITTRADAVTFLWRLYGSPTGYPNPGFIDVPPGTWYTDAVAWAAAEGITTGVGGTNRFEPNRTTTRYEFVTFIWRAAGSPTGPAGGGTWPPAPPEAGVRQDRWFSVPTNFAYATGIATGAGGTGTSPGPFDGNAGATRAQAVTFLQRFAAWDGSLGPSSIAAGLAGFSLDTLSGSDEGKSLTNTIAILAVVALALGVGLQLLRPRRVALPRTE